MPGLDWAKSIEGWFWLPATQPRKVRGVLTTSWIDGVELSLENHLFNDRDTHERVYGSDMAGRNLVLLDVFTRNQTYATNEPQRFLHILMANAVLLGTNRPKTRFPKAVAWFGALSDFLSETAISVDAKPARAVWEPPQRQLLHAAGMAIEFKHQIDLTGGYRSVQMRDDLQVEFRAKRGHHVSDWHRDIGTVDAFVGFCTGRPAAFERVAFSDYRNREVEYRFRLRPFRETSSGRPWLCQSHFGDQLKPALDRWYAYRDSSPEAFDMIAEYVAFGEDLNWADRLLLLARFLEVHHRRTRKGGQLPKEAHRARVKAILTTAPPGYRDWLKGTLAFSNNLPLYERLTEITATFGAGLAPLLGGDIQGFSRRVKDTRNYFTHYSSELRAKAAHEIDLVVLTKRLWFIVRGCVLLEFGFSTEEAIKALELDRDWRWLCRQPPS